MQLEDGKTYRNQLGEVDTVHLTHNGTDFPFTGDSLHRYMSDGRYLPKDMDETPVGKFRLVEEVK